MNSLASPAHFFFSFSSWFHSRVIFFLFDSFLNNTQTSYVYLKTIFTIFRLLTTHNKRYYHTSTWIHGCRRFSIFYSCVCAHKWVFVILFFLYVFFCSLRYMFRKTIQDQHGMHISWGFRWLYVLATLKTQTMARQIS